MKWTIRAVLAAWVVMALGGCEQTKDGAGAEEAVEESERQHFYSPYFLSGDGELPFTTISFTDVGLNVRAEAPVDAYLLEAIAESLAYKIITHEELNFTPEVRYDAHMEDPENHRFCDDAHLYVALWRGYDPDRWGYSLWSGCHEDQQFAWEEVEHPGALEHPDVLAQVDPLTDSIVASIHQAHQRSCYGLSCE